MSRIEVCGKPHLDSADVRNSPEQEVDDITWIAFNAV